MCSSPQLDIKRAEEDNTSTRGNLSSIPPQKVLSDVDQMSDSGSSVVEDSKVEQAQDGRWTQEEHYCFLKAVAIYGREVSSQ